MPATRNAPPSDGSDHPLHVTVKDAAAYDRFALTAALGGLLELLAENTHRLWRFQTVAALTIGRATRDDARSPSVADLRTLLNKGSLSAYAQQQDDYFADVMVEEVAFHGGSFRVMGGLAEDGIVALRRMLAVTLLSDLLPTDTRNALARTASAILRLSDTLVASAGLARNIAPPKPTSRDARIPGRSELSRLAELVTFDPERLTEATDAGDSSVFGPLIAPDDVEPLALDQVATGGGDRWPLRRRGDTVIVAAPTELGLALRHHLTTIALDAVGPEALAAVFGAVVDEEIADALAHLGIDAGSCGRAAWRVPLDRDDDRHRRRPTVALPEYR